MGSEIPPDRRPLAAVEALAREKPTRLMAQLRAIWPQVQQALNAGHTLRLIHKRLNTAGVPISYRVLVVYRGRIERGKKRAAHAASQTVAAVPQTAAAAPILPDDPARAAFDPLANLRAQEQREVGWRYPSGPPDESKLF